MALSALPVWPLVLFGILEPASLTWAYFITFFQPQQYYADQAPNTTITDLLFTPNALSLTLQLGNVFLLLAAMAVICCFTTHAEIARRYLIAVALADLGHIYSIYCALGDKVFWDLNQWNVMIYSNIGVSAFLHVNRLMTVTGMFGRLGTRENATKKNR
ncbi:hypothetical protein Z517_07544 [Fonsecaea pedrosoi CBS 271.37]|uniref:Unplaced genomic scaffold supercont1.5, whole genome shotgun sequence n=1 Tax=Fonsecaea pedrosoi CBS 271.37 TaxID=1442368 RepID=A0A0D2DJ67_9EURO|nr:uncharacterized protein Z517_07544 [Fonsecaea pedrosoi CBS 271.37]KIW77711.1 hypothetical protein Z517_07544 [Fonsecaea pedrosoi CBS 271.37]